MFVTLQQSFTQRYPELQRMASARFRHMAPERREEATQEALSLSWKYYLSLAAKKPDDADALLTSALYYACKHAGKRAVQGQKTTDVYDRCQRTADDDTGDLLDSFVSKGSSVFDKVSWRLDFSRFLDTALSDRQRQMAELLAQGFGTAEVASTCGVTPSAISQFRRRFLELFQNHFAV
jgi:DNA-binding NarL/FixJ family response regulator